MDIKIEKQINPSEGQTKIWNRFFISIFFVSMALNLGQNMSNSLLAKYADSMGAPASQVGMLMSMFAITALIFRFASGPAMDTYNRKHIIMGAMLIMATAYFGFSMSVSVSSLMKFRLLQGIGNAFGNVCCLAMVSEALPKNKFGTGMGYFSLAQVVSQAIGPVIGLTLVGWVGYSTTYIITGFVMLSSVLIASQIKIKFKRTKKLKISLSNIIAKEALLPAIIIFFVGMGFNTINSFLIVYAAKQGVQTGIGLFFTVYALTLLITRPTVGKLTDKYGFVKVGIPAIFFTGISFIIISVSTSLPMFLIAAFVNAFGFGACQPALQSLAMKSVPKERRGAAGSTNFIGLDLGTILGPMIAGAFAENLGYPVMWCVMTIPLIIGMSLVFIFRGKIVKIEENHRIRI
ncbi:MAG: MFS transporter [Mobilitalea sp.]